MIWDTFMYRGDAAEPDLLECRLRTLEDWPVRHVLVEAATDHQGHPKPLRFAENRERYAPWADRIVHVVADNLPGVSGLPDHWRRENAQRNAVLRGLEDADPADPVIVADLDEIPNAAAMEVAASVATRGEIIRFEMVSCIFAVDLLWPEPMRTSVVAPAARVAALSPVTVRQGGRDTGVVPGMGHHLTWLGGPEAVRAKMGAHCHVECNEAIGQVLEDGALFSGRNPFWPWSREALIPTDVDESWPAYVWRRECPPGWFRLREAAGAA